MRYPVMLTAGAKRDLEEIYNHIAAFGSHTRADYVMDRLVKVTKSLISSPERGTHPGELQALGIRESIARYSSNSTV